MDECARERARIHAPRADVIRRWFSHIVHSPSHVGPHCNPTKHPSADRASMRGSLTGCRTTDRWREWGLNEECHSECEATHRCVAPRPTTLGLYSRSSPPPIQSAPARAPVPGGTRPRLFGRVCFILGRAPSTALSRHCLSCSVHYQLLITYFTSP